MGVRWVRVANVLGLRILRLGVKKGQLSELTAEVSCIRSTVRTLATMRLESCLAAGRELNQTSTISPYNHRKANDAYPLSY
jgi:hypothetical protein